MIGRRRLKFIVRVLAVICAVSVVACVGIQLISLKLGFKSNIIDETYTVDTNINYITVISSNINVNLRYYDGDNIKIEYRNDTPIEIGGSESILEITQVSNFSVTLFSAKKFTYGMNIYLPVRNYRELTLNCGGGNVLVDGINTDILNISTKNGNININEFSGQLNVSTRTGAILCDYYALTAKTKIENENGTTTLLVPDFSGINLSLSSEAGTFTSDFFSEEYKRVLGNITAKQGDVPKKMNITTLTGDVYINKK